MLTEDIMDEVKRREHALEIIRKRIGDHGRSGIYDLTGLSGGFSLDEDDMALLETYVGPAVFEERLQEAGVRHLGGEKVAAFNRTSSAILAAVLAITEPGSALIHYLPEMPSHPSVPLSAELASVRYHETDDFREPFPEDTSLVVVTGSTMDHRVISESLLKDIIGRAGDAGIPVLVDDASGARLRTVIFNQRRACDLGADLAVTSTDKLMHGPRGGLMAGRADLIDRVKSKAYQFGLEAQPPLIAAMVRALEDFDPSDILEALERKGELLEMMDDPDIEETPTGIMIRTESLRRRYGSTWSGEDLSAALAMILLEDHGIITIPAAGMPGASMTIRLDLAAADAGRLGAEAIKSALTDSMRKLAGIIDDASAMRRTIFG
ncbi:TIGR03576 family pyridoxal phosphate-dependent enzyme [Methanothermobacter wolfeii]|uniref:TIGR03576 family pyridoxal phosphate-dependent enzyme n=1 Tax=Methanothermobacter wolfeii TaxID=145261 RepID=A0A9E7RVJ3_METWO|nr:MULTISPECIES: TIGR03576 family pyridoxal phosphate-dependent enzyme [Methanothermobacter]HIH70665.1 TIGR03576 family pyridoxal phosphate-dependent enzyme [Methanothermobacter thermautotrophicus]MDI6702356.1 TIGR03576 family pyridoxal phosphate-dependent enzyme [Methanothermobacter wolfeii]NLM03258.1 TIGR03576 family pyridoxal phosphate-dependent enzyme [Methanothermobacter wolfeii]QHN05980.1 TIGR03576 family pyridoxal phosphate-dependent enzyme [Methanothermobacter sp. THM-1]UXH32147.1 TIGR